MKCIKFTGFHTGCYSNHFGSYNTGLPDLVTQPSCGHCY